MTKIYQLIFNFFLFTLFACSPSQSTNNGKQRVISLAPSITEMVFALGGNSRLVGVSDFCSYPPEALKIEKVGGLFNPNIEKIMALKPDLILATNSYRDLPEKFKGINVKTVLLPEKTLTDVFTSIDSLGTLLGNKQAADSLHRAIGDSLEKYHWTDKAPRPKVMLVLGRDPGVARNIGVSGPGAFLDELLSWCGGINAFSDLKVSYSAISREALLARNPDIIIEFSPKALTSDQQRSNRKQWQSFKRIKAYKNNQIFVIGGNDFLIPGPRVYRLARRFYYILHPGNKDISKL